MIPSLFVGFRYGPVGYLSLPCFGGMVVTFKPNSRGGGGGSLPYLLAPWGASSARGYKIDKSQHLCSLGGKGEAAKSNTGETRKMIIEREKIDTQKSSITVFYLFRKAGITYQFVVCTKY